jgi:hypothetical protein
MRLVPKTIKHMLDSTVSDVWPSYLDSHNVNQFVHIGRIHPPVNIFYQKKKSTSQHHFWAFAQTKQPRTKRCLFNLQIAKKKKKKGEVMSRMIFRNSIFLGPM